MDYLRQSLNISKTSFISKLRLLIFCDTYWQMGYEKKALYEKDIGLYLLPTLAQIRGMGGGKKIEEISIINKMHWHYCDDWKY